MSFFQALILGIVQGMTEFFPVSSSAHLYLAKWILGIEKGEPLLFFDLICHSGTLVALLIFFRSTLWEILKDPKKIALYFVALIPLIPAYFFLKPIRTAASDPAYLGYALMATGALLWTAARKKGAPHLDASKKWKHVLCIGMMQTMALIPGISRSGSTISAARFCGWSWKEAAQFSFLLAIPTILGGEALEWIRNEPKRSIEMSCYIGGFISSFLFGSLSVRSIFWIYEKEKVKPFGWYCLIVGFFAWIHFNE